MRLLLTLLLLVVVSGKAHAESINFENCKIEAVHENTFGPWLICDSRGGYHAVNLGDVRNGVKLKEIFLDEISNKLDNLSPHDPFKSQFTKGTVIEKGQCPIFGLEHCWQNQSHTFSGPQSRVCLNCGLLEVKKTEWVVNKSLMQSTKKKNTSA